MPKIRNDYTVHETTNIKGEGRWHIKIGGTSKDSYIITTCRSKEDADYQAEQLNLDPYFFNRGQTRAELYPPGYEVPNQLK
tara:strand:+ start:2145 stop:2387 length:243 start_codon:yes stop_codon:yes gene_type:complete